MTWTVLVASPVIADDWELVYPNHIESDTLFVLTLRAKADVIMPSRWIPAA